MTIILPESENETSLLELVTIIASAYMSNCNLPPSELPHLIKTVHEALKSPDQTASSPIEPAWGGTKFLAPPQVARTLQMSKTSVLWWL